MNINQGIKYNNPTLKFKTYLISIIKLIRNKLKENSTQNNNNTVNNNTIYEIVSAIAKYDKVSVSENVIKKIVSLVLKSQNSSTSNKYNIINNNFKNLPIIKEEKYSNLSILEELYNVIILLMAKGKKAGFLEWGVRNGIKGKTMWGLKNNMTSDIETDPISYLISVIGVSLDKWLTKEEIKLTKKYIEWIFKNPLLKINSMNSTNMKNIYNSIQYNYEYSGKTCNPKNNTCLWHEERSINKKYKNLKKPKVNGNSSKVNRKVNGNANSTLIVNPVTIKTSNSINKLYLVKNNSTGLYTFTNKKPSNNAIVFNPENPGSFFNKFNIKYKTKNSENWKSLEKLDLDKNSELLKKIVSIGTHKYILKEFVNLLKKYKSTQSSVGTNISSVGNNPSNVGTNISSVRTNQSKSVKNKGKEEYNKRIVKKSNKTKFVDPNAYSKANDFANKMAKQK